MAFDLTKLKEKHENPKLLVKKEVKEEISSVKKAKPSKNNKIGRPRTEKEPMSSPLTINFTEKEYERIKEKAGLAPMSVYLREVIKKAGVV